MIVGERARVEIWEFETNLFLYEKIQPANKVIL